MSTGKDNDKGQAGAGNAAVSAAPNAPNSVAGGAQPVKKPAAPSAMKRQSSGTVPPTLDRPLLDYGDVEKLREGRAYQRYAADLQRVLATIEATPSSEWSTLSAELSHLSRCFQSHKEVAGRTPLPDPLLFARTLWQVLDASNVLGVQRKAIEVLQSYTELIVSSPYEIQFRAEQQREEMLFASTSRSGSDGKYSPSTRSLSSPAQGTAPGPLPRLCGRGRSQYVCPLEKDLPYLCMGILHMLPQSPVQLKPELLLFLEKSFLNLLPATLLMTAAQGFIAAVLHCLEEAESSSLYRIAMRLLRLLRGRLRMVPPVRKTTLGSVASLASMPSGSAGRHTTLEDEYAALAPPPEKSLSGAQAFYAAVWAIVRDVPSMRAPALHLLRVFILEEMEEVRDATSQQPLPNSDRDDGTGECELDAAARARDVERVQRDWLAGGRSARRLVHAALLRALQDERDKPQRLVMDIITAFFPLLARFARPDAAADAGAAVEPEQHLSILSWVFNEEEHTVLVAATLQLLGAPRTSSNVARRIVSWLDGSSHAALQTLHTTGQGSAPDDSRMRSVVVPSLVHTLQRAWRWWRVGPVTWQLEARMGPESAARVLDETPEDGRLWGGVRLKAASSTGCGSAFASVAPSAAVVLSPYECACFEALFIHAGQCFASSARHMPADAPSTATSGRQGLFSRADTRAVTARDVEAFPAVYMNAIRRLLAHAATATCRADDNVTAAALTASPPTAPAGGGAPDKTKDVASGGDDVDDAGDSLSEEAEEPESPASPVGATEPSAPTPRSRREKLIACLCPSLVPLLCDVMITHRHACNEGGAVAVDVPHRAEAGLVDHAFRELQKLLSWRAFVDYEGRLTHELEATIVVLLKEPETVASWTASQWSAAMANVDALLHRFYQLARCMQPFAQSSAPSPQNSITTRGAFAPHRTPLLTPTGPHPLLMEAVSDVCQTLVRTIGMASHAAPAIESLATTVISCAAFTDTQDPAQTTAQPGALTPLAQRCVAQQVLLGGLDALLFYYLTTFAGMQMEASATASAPAVACAAQTETTLLASLTASLSQLTQLFDPARGAPGLRAASEWLPVLEGVVNHFLSAVARHVQWQRSRAIDSATDVDPTATMPDTFLWLHDLVGYVSALPYGGCRDATCWPGDASTVEGTVTLCLWLLRLNLSACGLDGGLTLSVPLPRSLAEIAEEYVAQLVRCSWPLLGLSPTLDTTLAELLRHAYRLPKPRVALDGIMAQSSSLITVARTTLLLRATRKQQLVAPDSSDDSAYEVALHSAGLFFTGYVAVLRYLRACDGTPIASYIAEQCLNTDGGAPHPVADADGGDDIVHIVNPLSGTTSEIVVRTLVVDLLLDLAEHPLLLFVPLLQSFLLSLDSSRMDQHLPDQATTAPLPLVRADANHTSGGTCAEEHDTHVSHPRYVPLDAAEVVHHIKTLLALPQPVRLVAAAQRCAVPETVLGTLPSSIDESGEFNNSNGVLLGKMPVQNLFDAIACLLFALTRQSLLTERFERAHTASAATSTTSAQPPSAPATQPHRRSAAFEALQSLNALLRLSAAASSSQASSAQGVATVRCWQYTGLHSVTLLHLATEQNDAAVQAALLEHLVAAVRYVDAAEGAAVASTQAAATATHMTRPLSQLHRRSVPEDSTTATCEGAGVLEELKRRPALCLFLARRPFLQLAASVLSADPPNLVLTDSNSIAQFEARLSQWCSCVWELLPFLYGELKPFASHFYAILLRILWACQGPASASGARRIRVYLTTQRIQSLCFQTLNNLCRYLVDVSVALDAEMVVLAKWEQDRKSWLTSSTPRPNSDSDAPFLDWLQGHGRTLWQRCPLLEELRKEANMAVLVRCLVNTLMLPVRVRDGASGAAVACRCLDLAEGDAGDSALLAHTSRATEPERQLVRRHACALLTVLHQQAPQETMRAMISVWATLKKEVKDKEEEKEQTTRVDAARRGHADGSGRVSSAGPVPPAPSDCPPAHNDGAGAAASQLRRWVLPLRRTVTSSSAVLPVPSSPRRGDDTQWLSTLTMRAPFLLECVDVDVAQAVQCAAEVLSQLPAARADTLTPTTTAAGGAKTATAKPRSCGEAAITKAVACDFLLDLVATYLRGGFEDGGKLGGGPTTLLSSPLNASPPRTCPKNLLEAVLQLGSIILSTSPVTPRYLGNWVHLLRLVVQHFPSRETRGETEKNVTKRHNDVPVSFVEEIYQNKQYSQLLLRTLESFTALGALHTAVSLDGEAIPAMEKLTAALPALIPSSWKLLEGHGRVVDGLVACFQQCLLPTLLHGEDSPSEAEIVSRAPVVKVALAATRAFIVAGESSAAVREPHAGLAVGRRVRAALLQLLSSENFFRFPRSVLHEWTLVWELLSNDRTAHASACASFAPDTSVTSRLASIVTSFESEGRVRAQQLRALAFYTLSMSPAQINSREFVNYVKEQILSVVHTYSTTTLPTRKQIKEKRVLIAPARALVLLLRVLLLRFNDVQLSSLWPYALAEILRAMALFTSLRLEEPLDETPERESHAPQRHPGSSPSTTTPAPVRATGSMDTEWMPLDKSVWLDLASLHLDSLKWLDMVLLTHPERAVFFSWLFSDLSGATPRTLAMRGLRSPSLIARTARSKPMSAAETARLRAALHPSRALFFVPAAATITCSGLLSQASWQRMQPMVISPLQAPLGLLPTPTERLFRVVHERLAGLDAGRARGASRLFLCVPETHYCRRSEPGWCTLAMSLAVAAADAEWGSVALSPETLRCAALYTEALSYRMAPTLREGDSSAVKKATSHVMWATEAARTLRQSIAVDESAIGQVLLADFTAHDPDTGV